MSIKKYTEISKQTKNVVFERDNGLCIICKKQGIPNAHYIRRSQMGLGIEQNIVTLCIKCHHDYDNGNKREEYGKLIKLYLDRKYPDFTDDMRVRMNKWSL